MVTSYGVNRVKGYKPGLTTRSLPGSKPEYKEYIYSAGYDNKHKEKVLHRLLHPEQPHCLTTYKHQVAVYKLELALEPDSYPNLLEDLCINSRFSNRFFAEFDINEHEPDVYETFCHTLGFFCDLNWYEESERLFEYFSVGESQLNIDLVNRLFTTLFTRPENWETLDSIEGFDSLRKSSGYL